MIEKYYKVTLLSDIVLNSKLATEGNMETLNYIPGSNFLGIVAAQLYSQLSPEEAYAIFHSGKVSFGDATISKEGEISYPVPFDYMMVKGEDKLGKDKRLFLQHLLTDDNHPKENGYKLQLKQKRGGFITPSGTAITKIKKNFALKSAQDAENRRSKDGAMFGFESIKKGQEFIFSICFDDQQYIKDIEKALLAKKRVGKSKTAQYGQVKIEAIDNPQKIEIFTPEGDYTLVYAQSNLCFYDEFGQPTFQPKAKDFGLNGEINWKKCQVRTYEYSPWNGKRNTTDSLRACIAAGSVFYVEGKNEGGFKQVGAHQAEGLGRIIINPEFLKGNEKAECDFVEIIEKDKEEDKPDKERKSYEFIPNANSLAAFLNNKAFYKQEEIKLSQAIQREFEKHKSTFNKYKISASQWGAIRSYATKAEDMAELERNLIANKTGYLKHGVAFDRYWNKKGGKPLELFQNVCIQAKQYKNNGTIFITKFAAQMAKVAPKN